MPKKLAWPGRFDRWEALSNEMSHQECPEVMLVLGDLATSASGPNEIVKRLAGWLVNHGYAVTVVGTWRGLCPAMSELRLLYGGARIVLHRRYFKDSWHFAPGVLSWSIKLLFSRKAYVLDINSVWLFNGIVLSLIAKLKGWRYYVTLHGNLRPVSLNKNKTAKLVAFKLFVRRWLRNASGLIALNEQEKSDAHQLLTDAPFHIIGNGIKPHPLSLTSDRTKEVLFLGRIDPIKNLEGLIDGFSQVSHEFPDWKLNITGPCANPQYLLNLKCRCDALDLESRVGFHDAVYGKEKESRLLSASLFALTSWSEGQPFAVLEALAHGLPVLLSDQCNIDVPKTSGSVCGCSPGTIAQGLRELLAAQPVELIKMRIEAVQFVHREFSEDNAFDKRRSIYFPKDPDRGTRELLQSVPGV